MFDIYSVFPDIGFHSFKKFNCECEGQDFDKYESRINELFHFIIFSSGDGYYETNYNYLLDDKLEALDKFFDDYVNKNYVFFDGEIFAVDSDFIKDYYDRSRNGKGMLVPNIVNYIGEYYLRLDLWSNRFLQVIKHYENRDKLFREISNSMTSSYSITTDLILNYQNFGSKRFREELIAKIELGTFGGENALYASRILYYVYNDYKYSFMCLLSAHEIKSYSDFVNYRIAAEFLLMFNELEISIFISLTSGINSYCYRKLWYYYYSRLIDDVADNEIKDRIGLKYSDVYLPKNFIRKVNIDEWKRNSIDHSNYWIDEIEKYDLTMKNIFSLDLFIMDSDNVEYFFKKISDYQWENIIKKDFFYIYKMYEEDDFEVSNIPLVDQLNVIGKLLYNYEYYLDNRDRASFEFKKSDNAKRPPLEEKLKSLSIDTELHHIIEAIKVGFIHQCLEEWEEKNLDKYLIDQLSIYFSDNGFEVKNSSTYYYLSQVFSDSKLLYTQKDTEKSELKILKLFNDESTKRDAKKIIYDLICDVKKSDFTYGSGFLYRLVVLAYLRGDIKYAKELCSILFDTLILGKKTAGGHYYYMILYLQYMLNGENVSKYLDKIISFKDSRSPIVKFNKLCIQVELKHEIEAIQTFEEIKKRIGVNLTTDNYGSPKKEWGFVDERDFIKYMHRSTEITYKK